VSWVTAQSGWGYGWIVIVIVLGVKFDLFVFCGHGEEAGEQWEVAMLLYERTRKENIQQNSREGNRGVRHYCKCGQGN